MYNISLSLAHHSPAQNGNQMCVHHQLQLLGTQEDSGWSLPMITPRRNPNVLYHLIIGFRVVCNDINLVLTHPPRGNESEWEGGGGALYNVLTIRSSWKINFIFHTFRTSGYSCVFAHAGCVSMLQGMHGVKLDCDCEMNSGCLRLF